MPVIPGIWVAEAGESLEPGRRRLRWAEIVPPYFNLGKKSKTPSQKKKKLKINKKDTRGNDTEGPIYIEVPKDKKKNHNLEIKKNTKNCNKKILF